MSGMFWSTISLLFLVLVTNGWAASLKSEAGDPGISAGQSAADNIEPVPSRIGLQLMSFLYGPTVGDPGSGLVPTTWTDQVSGVSLQNQIVGRYALNDDLILSAAYDFEVLINDPNHVYGSQYVAMTYDSFLKVSYDNLLGAKLGNNWGALNADIRGYLPTSEYSRDNGSLGSLRLTLTPNLQIGKSGLSLALVNFARVWFARQAFETQNPSAALPRLMLYTGPLVSYQLTPALSLWALGEASVTYDTQGVSNTSQPNRSLVDIEPGLEFKVNQHFTVSPYLNWFIRQPIDTTSMNLTASYSL